MKLIDVFPYGTGFVLVFEYMLSDLSEVLRNSARPLTEVSEVTGIISCKWIKLFAIVSGQITSLNLCSCALKVLMLQ